jgi:hypothetical protein
MAKLEEALEIAEWIRTGTPISCAKGSADEYMLAMADEIEKLRAALKETREAVYREVGRHYSELLQIATPADHIRSDEARERELSIYRGESKYWYSKARAEAEGK